MAVSLRGMLDAAVCQVVHDMFNICLTSCSVVMFSSCTYGHEIVVSQRFYMRLARVPCACLHVTSNLKVFSLFSCHPNTTGV